MSVLQQPSERRLTHPNLTTPVTDSQTPESDTKARSRTPLEQMAVGVSSA